MDKYTEDQFEKVGHTLGINIFNARLSKDKNDKVLPNEFYRNYYNYGLDNEKESDWITGLSEFIKKWKSGSLYYFAINDKGIELFRKQFDEEITKKYIPLSRSKQRYLDFLDSDSDLTFAEYIGIKKKK